MKTKIITGTVLVAALVTFLYMFFFQNPAFEAEQTSIEGKIHITVDGKPVDISSIGYECIDNESEDNRSYNMKAVWGKDNKSMKFDVMDPRQAFYKITFHVPVKILPGVTAEKEILTYHLLIHQLEDVKSETDISIDIHKRDRKWESVYRAELESEKGENDHREREEEVITELDKSSAAEIIFGP